MFSSTSVMTSATALGCFYEADDLSLSHIHTCYLHTISAENIMQYFPWSITAFVTMLLSFTCQIVFYL